MSKLSLTRLTFYLHKRFFTAKPLHKSTSSSSFTIEYLTNSCGLSLNSAISASKRVKLVKKNKPHYDSVVNFLKTNRFCDTQIIKLVQKHPVVLSSRISDNLEQKIQFFTKNGVSSSLVPKIFVLLPNIICRSIDAQLRPVMELLREYITCDDKLQAAILRASWILNCDVKNKLKPNVEFLIQQGVPRNRIGDLLVTQPRCLYYTSFKRLVNAVDRIGFMGVMPSSNVFIYSLRVMLNLSDLSWKRKVKVFESMGWSYDEVVSMFVRTPLCLALSEKKLRNTMDFLVNTAKIDPKIVIGYPKILMYSLEKRIVPRYAVWKILTERGLIPKTIFIWLLNRSDEAFTHSYVTRFSTEIPHLRSIYDQSKKLGRVCA